MANYEAFRAMYESRNSKMFRETTGILTWLSDPAQPSFVWQLYHYDLEPNSALYATQKAAEVVHVQLNEADRNIEVVNNQGHPLLDLKLTQSIYRFDGTLDKRQTVSIASVPASTAEKVYTLWVNPHISELYFLKLDLTDAAGKLLSTNFYWQNVAEDDYAGLMNLPIVTLAIQAQSHVSGDQTVLDVTVNNPTPNVALLTHLQLHQQASGQRVLPVFYSDNYLSLAPGESRALTIKQQPRNLAGGAALLVDGYNVDVTPVDGPVAIRLNDNAQPLHWPASNLVPGRRSGQPMIAERGLETSMHAGLYCTCAARGGMASSGEHPHDPRTMSVVGSIVVVPRTRVSFELQGVEQERAPPGTREPPPAGGLTVTPG